MIVAIIVLDNIISKLSKIAASKNVKKDDDNVNDNANDKEEITLPILPADTRKKEYYKKMCIFEKIRVKSFSVFIYNK